MTKKCLAMQIWDAQYEPSPHRQVEKYVGLLQNYPNLNSTEILKNILLANNQAEKMALTDPLTGVDNRTRLEQRLREEIALYERHNTSLSVAMLDLDHFKKVNDTCGHLAGDYVLTQFAKLIRTKTRIEDVVARYGGEEFVISFPNTSLNGARTASEHIRKAVENNEFIFDGIRIPVTVSIGLSTVEQGDDFESLLSKADKALYQAKSSGRNQVFLYDPLLIQA